MLAVSYARSKSYHLQKGFMPAVAIPESKILIIDDDEGILTTVRILLRRHFGIVHTGNTPQKITQLLHQEQYNVVLLDMNFNPGDTSGNDGFRWLEHINQQSPGTSVVLMTAYGEIDLAIKAMKQGAVDFVVKPWENDKLLSALTAAFRKSKFAPVAPAVHSGSVDSHSEVEKIFMFLDLKGSTTMAENLGHVKYFSLLSDFFSDISDPIEKRGGEIYQYVGDEVVITWPIKAGLQQANCLHTFFDIQSTIQQKSSEYMRKFGLVPVFKAGIHSGMVSTGWVGKMKKEIVYSGDVLNTTARIEGLCNKLQEPVLISETLLLHLSDQLAENTTKEVGMISLRGRNQPVKLFAPIPPAQAD